MAGRALEAGLQLLDRQLIDKDGRLAGKVDDLELELPEGGGPPVVTAILSGPGALSRRVGGRLGAWLEVVVNQAGGSAGHVHDVRLVQDGPVIGGFGASLRVDGLIVGPRSTGGRLGY